MVARIEPVPVLKYQAYCDEQHKHLGTFDTHREAMSVALTHNETCETDQTTLTQDPPPDPRRPERRARTSPK